MWEKLSSDTGVTDICIAINGFVVFSFTYINIEGDSQTNICFLNHRIYNRESWKEENR